MAHTVDLPLELVDYILIFLRGDVVSLQACSRAGETFLDIAERHIYNHIVLHNSVQPSDGYLSTTPEQMSKALAISPHLSTYVKSLQISITLPGVLSWILARSLNDKAMAPVLIRLTNLEHIVIAGWRGGRIPWNGLHSTLRDALCKVLASPLVTDVVLDGVDDFPLSVLNHSSMLQNLSLIQSTFTLAPNASHIPASPQTLRSLSIQVFPGTSLQDERQDAMTWLLDPTTSPDISNLKYLSIKGPSRICEHILSLLPATCAESLECLQLFPEGEVNESYDLSTGSTILSLDASDCSQLNLSTLSHLRSLVVTARVGCKEDFWVSSTGEEIMETATYTTPFVWISQMLETAPSLTHIRLDMCFSVTHLSFERIDWSRLTQALLSMQLLQSVAFMVSEDDYRKFGGADALVRALQNEKQFAELKGKGLLSISKSGARRSALSRL